MPRTARIRSVHLPNIKAENLKQQDIKKLVCITYCGVSGSYLLSNLLDWQSNSLSVPPSAIFWAASSIKRMLDLSRPDLARPHIDIKKFVNKIPDAFPELFSRIDIHGQIVERDFGVEVNRFSEVLRELLIKEQEYSERIDVTSAFKSLQLAYAISKDRKFSTKHPAIFWQRHLPLTNSKLKQIKKDIPELASLVCVRRFDLALDRHLSMYLTSANMPTWAAKAKILIKQFGHATCMDTKTIEVAAVKFEDLHCRPEHMITQIFEHYGIDCDCEIDTRTTCDGKIYVYTASNGEETRSTTGTDPTRAALRNYKFLTWFDRLWINFYLDALNKKFGYSSNNSIVYRLTANNLSFWSLGAYFSPFVWKLSLVEYKSIAPISAFYFLPILRLNAFTIERLLRRIKSATTGLSKAQLIQ